MKVVHLLQSDRFSGAENVVCQIIEMFKDEPNTEMVYVSIDGPIRNVLAERKIPFYALQKFDQRSISQAMNNLMPDIIHAHDFTASVRAAIQHHTHIISHLHNNPKWISRLCIRTICYRLSMNRFDLVLGVSNAILNEFLFSNKLRESYVCLPNIVNVEEIVDKANEDSVSAIDILFVGRLTAQKNPIAFLEIIKDICNRYQNRINVVMIGEGELRQECESFIVDNKLENTVEMIGFTSNPYKYMKSAKMIIMPSIYEGFGLVAVEAMSFGTIVLASPVGGLTEIIQDDCGFLCRDVREFSEIAINVLNNSIDCDEISRKAKKRARDFSDLYKYKQKLSRLYRVIYNNETKQNKKK